ncbi:GGDEF domain-containing protein [Ruminococcus sp. CLA-AA-H200]|uniref:GGDEF domain-containing protein n=1 Tax=Ruminococcus turbiniformis TaxID=2881258 RepID=A0ABS8FW13_9FIRM|nr:GGDEF domain-containing protein [Ruminococcus turbiniformis]MCC2254183.1 GGDEF domain-containing protein [Ruminococcus turbiniformis]
MEKIGRKRDYTMIFNTKELVMTSEQERLFRKKARAATGKYFWAAVLFVLVFQIYNIGYVLYYTEFRLGTESSRIYMTLYVIMLAGCAAASALGLLWTFSKKDRDWALLILYAAFCCLLLFWSACVTLYDHRVSDNISVYMTSAIYVAGLIYMRPKVSVPVFLICEAGLLAGLLQMDLNGIKDTYGSCVNSVGLTIVAAFISLYRWSSMRRDFLNHLEIEEKNRMITEQSEKLSYMANHDALTGLWNRNYLNEWKENFFKSGKEGQVSVFITDIDYFKQYNDAFGHVKGDECLKKIADALQEIGGIVFRFGGEEFLCIELNKTADQVDSAAERICRYIEAQQIESAVPGRYLSVSVGYSSGVMQNDTEFRMLLHEADKALYEAKRNGRNQAVRFEQETGD